MIRSLFILVFSLGFATPWTAFADPGSELRCASASDCPSWVAWLRTRTSSCTSFLVQEDVMATNYHCIPANVLHEGADCSEAIWFLFPTSDGHSTQKVECDRILHLSGPPNMDSMTPDFAFVRIKEKVKRRFPSLNRAGFADGQIYDIFRINPEEDGSGLLLRTPCKATQETVINPFFSADKSPVVTFANCLIRHGNSGSPILASDGTLRGILNAKTEMPTTDLVFATEQVRKVDSAHGTNFSCLQKDIVDSESPDKICEMPLDVESKHKMTTAMIEKKIAAAIASLEKKVNETTKKLLSMDRAFFAWGPQREKMEELSKQDRSYLLSVKFDPLCLVPGVQNIAASKNRLKNSPVTFHIETPRYAFHGGVDEQLKFRVEIREEQVKQDVRLTPTDLLQMRKIPVDFAKSDTQDFHSQNLDLCWLPAAKQNTK